MLLAIPRAQSACLVPPAACRGGKGNLSFRRALVLGVALIAVTLRADLQFDVFVGYGSSGGSDGIVREGCWFPVACEVFNDGPAFDAVFEFSSRQTGGGQVRQMKIELPTNTRKRFVFPLFAGSSRYATWQARLLDASGKVRAEHPNIQVQDVSRESYLVGGLGRSFAGLPVLPQAGSPRGPQARVARMTVEQFPDNPLALEGLGALYLNSEKALDLKVGQAAALATWVHGGGELMVGIEQAQDVTSTRWLGELLPIELTGTTTNRSRGEIHEWLAGGAGANPRDPYSLLEPDSTFEQGEFLVFTGVNHGGKVDLSVGGQPMVVSARRGRGTVTVLLFSPEREPFKSWKHRQWFWARLAGLPGDYFAPAQVATYGGISVDGVIGAMIETRQTRKLPVEWLLALLTVYLIVIGPLDYWWLKKINRQMLTWLTFPAYVAIFSLLIYWLGYKLRAGETEWSEFHITDVLPRDGGADLRGRTFASLYSSVNARYKLASDLSHAALRSEYRGFIGGGQESSRINAELVANAFRAEVGVPVWSSQMYVSDWIQAGDAPLSATLTRRGNQLSLAVENRLGRVLGPCFLVYEGRLHELGNLVANQRRAVTMEANGGRDLATFVRLNGARFQNAAMSRNQAFGRMQESRLDLTPDNAVAVSFISMMGSRRQQQSGIVGPPGTVSQAGPPQRGFVSPPGQELGNLLAKGDAVVMAWDAGQSPVANPLLRSKAPRANRNNMYRLAVPVTRAEGLP